jgi:hypothetical protein
MCPVEFGGDYHGSLCETRAPCAPAHEVTCEGSFMPYLSTSLKGHSRLSGSRYPIFVLDIYISWSICTCIRRLVEPRFLLMRLIFERM